MPTSNQKRLLNYNQSFFLQSKKLEESKSMDLIKIFLVSFSWLRQTSDIHAFAMFDYFTEQEEFLTQHIYNNGIGDKYLEIGLTEALRRVLVLGKGAHTPDCRPECIKPQIIESLKIQISDKIDIYCPQGQQLLQYLNC